MEEHNPSEKLSTFKGTIAVTGAAGHFGGLLVRRLHRTDSVITIDNREFDRRPRDVTHFQTDLRSKYCKDLFRRGKIQAIVHLGPQLFRPHTEHGEDSFELAVENFARLLENCDRYNVKKLILLSSSDIYGARARNPQFLTEESPLLAADLSTLRDVDMMAQSFFWRRPDIETVILRPAHITGDVANIISRYFRLSPVPRLMGYDPMIQLVHEEDVVEAIRLALLPGHRGIFNIAGPPPLPLSRILRRLGRSTISVPHVAAKPLLSQLHRLGRIEVRTSFIDYIRYVCMVDDTRARSELHYAPRHSLDETIAAVDMWE